MSSLHRVFLPKSVAPAEGSRCRRCGFRTPIGLAHCARCGVALFRPQPGEVHGVGRFSRRVRRGEDMPSVTGYLRANLYPIGESPAHFWRRKRRQLVREQARCLNANARHLNTKSNEQEEE